MTHGVELRMSYNASEDTFPLPDDIKARYGPFGFPAPPVGNQGRRTFVACAAQNWG